MLRFSAVSTANLSSGTHAQAQNLEPAHVFSLSQFKNVVPHTSGRGGVVRQT